MIKISSVSKHFSIKSHPLSILKSLLFKKNSVKFFTAVSNININIKRGEVFGIIGRNGAGKSTLLQLVCGTLSPSNGKIDVKGTIGALLELGAGFHPDFTGIENIYLTASIMGLTKKQTDKYLNRIIEFAGINEFINMPVSTYSTGMSMRLAFSIATTTSPDVLIIDEALSVGDQEFSQKSFNRIMELRDNGTTILFCSHSTYQVEALCDRVVWLEKGKIIKLGPAKEVTMSYQENQEVHSYKKATPNDNASHNDNKSIANIKKIEFFKNGNLTPNNITLMSRVDELKTKVYFYAKHSVPSLALSIRKISGEIIASAGSLNDDCGYILAEDGKKYFEIDFPKISLLKGNYYIDITLFCKHGINTLDFATRVFEFKISQDDMEQGVAHLNHKWVGQIK